MRGRKYRNRKKRVLLMAVGLGALCFYNINQPHWINHLTEDKLSEFLGGKLNVQVASVTDGVFRDMALEDVEFSTKEPQVKRTFRLERIEISFRFWDAVAKKIGFGKERTLKYVALYFSDENPFIRGFIKLYSYPDRIELFGNISPVFFGDYKRRAIKGTFLRRPDNKYNCSLSWDGKVNVNGLLDPVERKIDLAFTPTLKEETITPARLIGYIDETNSLIVYARLDKIKLFNKEIIGDLRISYNNYEMPVFLVKLENLIIDKKPMWDLVLYGAFSNEEKKLFLHDARWGENFVLTGEIALTDPYVSTLKLAIKDLELESMAEMFGQTKTPAVGKVACEVNIKGPIKEALINGRLYISKGMLGGVEFRSAFATLEGKLPIVKLVDARIIEDGGYIIVSGEMDFSKQRGNEIFERLLFESDNKVAVWEEWHIAKEKQPGVVEAKKDRMVFRAPVDDSNLKDVKDKENRVKKELGIEYELDSENSIKVKMEEKSDFVGVQHKLQF